MRKLKFKEVFSKYEKPISSILARKTFSLYKRIRSRIAKWFPLKDSEKISLEEHYLNSSKCSDMPKGHDTKTNQEVDGIIELKFLDYYDYLPKENIDDFEKHLQKFARNNKTSIFSSFRTVEDAKRIYDMGRYFDGKAFSNLHTIEISDNYYLEHNAPQVTISIHNLSSSFSLVKYRFFISDKFNEKLHMIYRKRFSPYSDVYRRYNVPWYKPWKFGKSMFTGDNGRAKALYSTMAELKWNAYKEIENNFRIFFENDKIFPPIFETYHTNIKPNNDRESQKFWESIGLNYYSDYSTEYNLCVSFGFNVEKNEGINVRAFGGDNYKKNNSLPEIAEHNISDKYGVYMVASSIRRIAERDIAIWNKKISKVVRQNKPYKLLKVRTEVDQKLYYCNRFMSEFTGATLDRDDDPLFKNPFYKKKSMTKICFDDIVSEINDTKHKVDVLLNLLNNAAEFQSAKLNMLIQKSMIIITFLSLLIALITLVDVKIDVLAIWKSLHELLVSILKLNKESIGFNTVQYTMLFL